MIFVTTLSMPEKYELSDIDNKTIKSEQNKYITEIMNLSDEMKITIFPFFMFSISLKKLKKNLNFQFTNRMF